MGLRSCAIGKRAECENDLLILPDHEWFSACLSYRSRYDVFHRPVVTTQVESLILWMHEENIVLFTSPAEYIRRRPLMDLDPFVAQSSRNGVPGNRS